MPGSSARLIGVIGSSECSGDISRIAEGVGRGIARRGDILVCGGLGGVMEAACKGAKLQGGITIGILPGGDRLSANRYVDIPIVSGLGHARNLIIVQSAHAIVAVAGGYGTLSEIAFASLLDIPMVGIRTWGIETSMLRAKTAEDALERLYSKI